MRSVVLRACDRLQSFLFKAGKVLIPVIMVLSVLNSIGTDGSFGNENTDKSALASISKIITPALRPMGVTVENWPATVGIFTGIFAKEAVVGTLDALYTGIDQQAAEGGTTGDGAFDFWGGISGAFATLPENLRGVIDTLADPLGLSVGNVSDTNNAAEEQEVNVHTFGSMVRLFGSQSAAFAYLLFVLLYFPCSAAIAAVYRETNWAWTGFIGFWTTFLAYFASTLFYQVLNFTNQPSYAALVIGLDLCVFGSIVLLLKVMSHRSRTPRLPAVTQTASAGCFVKK
jgi:ferrous iron transport protein B